MALMYWIDSPMTTYRPRQIYDPFRELRQMERQAMQLMNSVCDDGREEVGGNTIGEVTNDAEKFAISLNCSNFRPEELTVDVKGKALVVEGRHEEKSDQNGTIQRHFIRKYALPKDVNSEAIQCHLTEQGQLSVIAPKAALEAPKRNIQIQPAPEKPAVTNNEKKSGA